MKSISKKGFPHRQRYYGFEIGREPNIIGPFLPPSSATQHSRGLRRPHTTLSCGQAATWDTQMRGALRAACARPFPAFPARLPLQRSVCSAPCTCTLRSARNELMWPQDARNACVYKRCLHGQCRGMCQRCSLTRTDEGAQSCLVEGAPPFRCFLSRLGVNLRSRCAVKRRGGGRA